jgi:predicted RNase H-like HicB family nuclease
MVLKILVHKAEEGGYWAEVPALPGCFTQAESLEELRDRARESIEAYLGVGEEPKTPPDTQVWEIAVYSNEVLKRGALAGLLRQAGLDEADL